MSNPPPSLTTLFLEFIRLGATAFGGPSMVAYIRQLAVDRKNWLTPREFGAGVALCQVVPGATAMQTAAYVGLRVRGVSGAAACFLGFSLPAFALMLFFAVLYSATGTLPAVAAAFSGLQAVVVAVVANAAFSFGRSTLQHGRQVLIAGAAAGLFWVNLHPLFVILLAAGLGGLLLSAAAKEPAGVTPLPFYRGPFLAILGLGGLLLAALFFLSNDLFSLALLMLRIDLLAFGGGFASVPLMYHEVVEVNAWLSSLTFMNGILLGQVTPGPIVITATFIGYLLAGAAGAVVASIYIFLPSFLMVIGVAPFFNRFSSAPLFQKIMQGILCSFVGLLVSVTLRFALQVQWDWIHLLLAGAALTALLRKVDILWVVLAGTLVSVGLIR